jgi:hypothetical protein
MGSDLCVGNECDSLVFPLTDESDQFPPTLCFAEIIVAPSDAEMRVVLPWFWKAKRLQRRARLLVIESSRRHRTTTLEDNFREKNQSFFGKID